MKSYNQYYSLIIIYKTWKINKMYLFLKTINLFMETVQQINKSKLVTAN